MPEANVCWTTPQIFREVISTNLNLQKKPEEFSQISWENPAMT